jgi:hypothetical protein
MTVRNEYSPWISVINGHVILVVTVPEKITFPRRYRNNMYSVCRSAGIMMQTYREAYTATGKEICLAKAKFIANAFTKVQEANEGDYPISNEQMAE